MNMVQPSDTSSREVEKAVLRHPEGIQPAIICAVVLALMVEFLVSTLREHHISEVVSLVVLWGVVFVAITAALVWSVAGSTVVQKQFGRLTMSLALGGALLWEVKSVPLTDLSNVVVRERVYGYKGKRIDRYEVVFGRAGEERELMGFLTKRNAELLVNGVLREFLSHDRSTQPK